MEDRLDIKQKVIIDHWVTKLAQLEVPEVLDQGTPEQVTHTLSSASLQGLASMCHGNEVAEYTVLLSVFGLMVNRYWGTSEILVVSELPATQAQQQAAPLFLNLQIPENSLFKEVIGHAKREIQQAVKYGNYSYLDLVSALSNLGKAESDLFRFGFTYNGSSPPNALLHRTGYRLNLRREKQGALTLELKYPATDTGFNATLAKQFCDQFERVIQQIKTLSATPTYSIDLLSEGDRKQLLYDFNDTHTAYPRDHSLGDLFEAQASKTPQSQALLFEGGSINYQELESKANQLAHFLLKEYQLQPESIIGLSCTHNERLIIAVLAIIKAGAAYLPIDPTYPKARIQYMLKDARPQVLLVESAHHAEHIDFDCGIVVLDTALEQLETSTTAPEISIAPDSLAYVMYTSGSTGVPKGVMISHRNIIRLVRNTNFFQFTPVDRLLATGSISFDASTLEIWGPLLNGASLVLAPQAALLEEDTFGAHILRHEITVLWLTSSLFNHFVNRSPEVFASLQTVLVGGEKLSPHHINLIRDAYPHLTLINGYGPTENTTFTATFEIDDQYETAIPIGRPIANTQIFILNGQDQLCPIGVYGELCTSGDGLSRGYLNDPELTESRFTPHPFQPGKVLYRTGDVARWKSNGTIEFHGRKDNLLKVRGYRVEPGEIEHHLRALPYVQDAIVLAVKNAAMQQELAAYLVLDPSHPSPESGQLRQDLGIHLPDYMQPSRFIKIEQIPFTRNGKLDRQALPDAFEYQWMGSDSIVLPQNPTEEKLATIWQQLLKKPQVGRNENFFEMGGHSLKASMMVAKIHKEMGIKLELPSVFAHPTIAELAESFQDDEGEIYRSIQPVPVQDSYPLSHAQKRLWVLSQFEAASIAYNVPGGCRLSGPIQIKALQNAFLSLVERHESLRTVFITVKGEPRQKILPLSEWETEMEFIDLRHAQQEAEVLLNREAAKPFDLEKGPLFRATLIQTEDAEFSLLFTLHHIISDGWSLDVMIQDLLTFYHAFRYQLPTLPGPLPIQYKDFAAWQKEQDRETEKAYWLNQLSAPLPVLELPADRVRPKLQTFKGDSVPFHLNGKITHALKTLHGQQGSTLFMLLLAAVKVLLHRYTGQEEILVGSPVTGRAHADLEAQVGFYVNTLPFLSQIDPEQSFLAFLNQVHSRTVENMEHQGYPLDLLIDELGLKRDVSRPPLFNVVLVLHNQTWIREGRKELEGIEVQNLKPEHTSSKFDLTFSFTDTGDAILGGLEYNTDLFNRDRIERLAGHFGTLIDSILGNPEGKIKALDLLPNWERQHLMALNAPSGTVVAQSDTLVSLFSAQAKQRPAATALIVNGHSLTYQELDQQSDRVAHQLREQYSVLPGELVGLMMNRSGWLVIGILGILKTGGAYVPIDLKNPPERVKYILEDSSIRTLLTLSGLTEGITTQVEQVDIRALVTETVAAPLPAPTLSSGSPAYVIYTSGTTGNPKGCQVSHGNVVSLFHNSQSHFQFGPDDVWTLAHSYAFDFSVWELFGALLHGGTLVIPLEEDMLDYQRFLGLLTSHKVTVLNQTPEAFYLLAQLELANPKHTLSEHLRTIIFGGDKLEPRKLNAWVQTYPLSSISLVNMYGITETTVHVTYYQLQPSDIVRTASPIGKGLPGVQTYVFDAAGNLAPVGIPGELFVGGPGVSLGYINQPELTQSRFVNHPLHQHGKLYKTGDLARWLPEGNLEYISRNDSQVKIKGYRIELGEIAATLQDHPQIETAIVRIKSLENGDPKLVAYLLTPALPGPTELHTFCNSRLPEYMVPHFFIRIEEVPLTTNGKLIEAKLPDINSQTLLSGMTSVPPANPTEATLAAIWATHLGLAEVSAVGNYFSLGGDSIKALSLVMTLHTALGIKVEIKDIYLYPTIRSLSNYLLEGPIGQTDGLLKAEQSFENLKRTIQEDPQLSKALPENWQDLYPISDIEKGMVFHNLLDPASGAYHDQFFYYIEDPDFDFQLFHKANCLLEEKHEILRSSFAIREFEVPMKIVHHSTEKQVDISWEDLSGMPAEKQETYLQEFAQQDRLSPFEITEPGLWRVRVFQLNPAVQGVLLVFHHAILDGWSHASLMTELTQIYEALKADSSFKPTPLTATYRDYVLDQWKNKDSNSTKRFWEEMLEDHKRTALPFHKPVTETYSASGLGHHAFALDPALFQSIKDFAASAHISPKEVFLAAYAWLLKITTNTEDLTFGLVSNGRPEIEDGDKIIGCFLNTVPFRIELAASMTPLELVQKVKEISTQIKPHDRLSLIEIASLKGDEYSGRNPIFDLFFNYTDFHIYDQVSAHIKVKQTQFKGSVNTNVPLEFSANHVAGKVEVLITFRPGLYTPQEISRLEGFYNTILQSMTQKPTAPFLLTKLIGEAETKELLQDFNPTFRAYPKGRTIVEMLEETVAKFPDQPALAFGQNRYTYRQLNQRINRLVNVLQQKYDLKSGEIVGVCMDRSEWWVISMLAVWKAGGVYLPFVPDQPQERIRYIVENSGCRLVLTDGKQNSELLAEQLNIHTLNWNQELPQEVDTTQFPTQSAPSFIIYTSGSTGKPKGVVQTHLCLSNLINWHCETMGLGFRVLQFTSIGFDVSLHEALYGLVSGGTLYMIEDHLRLDLKGVSSYIQEHALEVTWLPPSMISSMFHEDFDGSLETGALQFIIATGEQVKLNAGFKQFLKDNPDLVLYNFYGPSETHLITTYRLTGKDELMEFPPIGTPISNTQIYILDEAEGLLPKGVIGELCAGGANLARDYLNDPERTAERFVPNPFEPGTRIYRTGDLARWLPDGNLEFHGRMDDQIKIRGFRVELGEIEQRLLTHPSVKSAAVVTVGTPSEGLQLAAYVVSESELTAQTLIQHLKVALPDFMIPGYFVPLSELPLTVNGKLNKKALPDPQEMALSGGTALLAPRNETETQLVAIWQQLLGRASIGIQDNFFEIGGHSLLAARLLYKIEQVFGTGLELRSLFTYPTIEEIAKQITPGLQTAQAGIYRLPDQAHYDLSPGQKRLWILDRMEKGTSTYNIPGAFRLKGQIDQASLNLAFKAMIERHEILRTRFITIDGLPRQEILQEGDTRFEIKVIDIQGEGNPELSAKQLATAEASTPFDLAQCPLFRATILKLGETDHVLLITMHHIVSDGWSINVFIRELLTCYQSFRQALPIPLPDLDIHYRDYTAWYQAQLESENLERHRSYWQAEFKDGIPVLELPTFKQRPKVKTFKGDVIHFRINDAEKAGLVALGHTGGATLFMVLLSAFTVLLRKYSGQNDLVIGTPVAGRDHPDLENQLGFYVNTVALRTQLEGKDSFSTLLEKVREKVISSFSHQHYPFDQLVDELEVERNLSRSPIFDVMMVFQNRDMESSGTSEIDGLEINRFKSEQAVSKFDLTLFVENGIQGLACGFEYNSDLFSLEQMQRMADHFKNLLSEIIRGPSLPISSLDMLGLAERKQLVEDWNQPQKAPIPTLCTHQLFQAQAKRTPQSIAVCIGNLEMSYASLDQKSNRLAHKLVSLGVGSEVIVGLMIDPCVDMLVAILAIHKAGGAYLPIDTVIPPERISFMLKDSGASLLLTHRKHVQEDRNLFSPSLLFLEEIHHENEGSNSSNTQPPVVEVRNHHLAYLLYTSGTTGTPNGVAVHHGGLANYVTWAARTYAPESPTGFALYSSISFDLTITSLFPALISGHRVVIHTGEDKSQLIHEVLTDDRVGVVKITPSHLKLLEGKEVSQIRNKRLVIGGEALESRLVLDLSLQMGKNVEFFNEYGPTETVVGSTVYPFDPTNDHQTYLPIGKPIAHTEIYLLDQDDKPAAIGVTGEICIAGAGVAQGYLNQPELTARKFAPHPFHPDSRMYRTGDLARWLPDGNLDFRGRKDDQIKIRGYRVELGEIEQKILTHSGVHTVAVLPIHTGPNGSTTDLVAYVVSDQELSVRQIQQHLKTTLPEYMIPGYFVSLPELPLTVNGKLDKKALPDPRETALSDQETYVPASNKTQTLLVEIWQELLGRPQIGVRDNFFEIGGHSLLAARLLFRIEQAFETELELRTLFAYPTIEGFADQIEGQKRSPFVNIQRVTEQEHYDLSPGQKRLWILNQMEGASGAYNIPGAYQLKGPINLEVLQHAFDFMISRHEILRTRFILIDGLPRQEILPQLEAGFELQFKDLSLGAEPQTQARTLAAEEAQKPFDLSQSPLLRATVLKTGKAEHVLMLTMHHIVSDGWSMNVFIHEILTFYQSSIRGDAGPFKPLPIHYRDYVAWNQQQMDSEKLALHRQYWQEEFKTGIPVLELPTSFERPKIKTYHGDVVRFQLGADQKKALIELGKSQGATLFMVLLSVFKVFLRKYAGQEEMVVGTPVAGRDHLDQEKQLGFFVNTLAIRSQVKGQENFETLLKKVKEKVIASFAHQNYPFDQLVEELEVDRNLSRSPIFDVMLVLQNQQMGPYATANLDGIEAARFESDQVVSKFDLTLFVEEGEQELMGSLEYNTDLFTRSQIERMTVHFRNLIREITTSPTHPISTLKLLDEDEQQGLLSQWNRAKIQPITRVHTAFEAQAARTPENIALIHKEEKISYKALNEKANQLAQTLRSKGISDGDIVALMVNPGVDMIVGILAVHKAGGAYLPIDTNLPSARKAFMLQDSKATLMLARREESTNQTQLAEVLPPNRWVYLEEFHGSVNTQANQSLAPVTPAKNHDLAYLLYTSGTTGQPNGVAVTHGGLANYVAWASKTYVPDAPTGFALYTSISFDLTITSLFPPLVTGNTVVIHTGQDKTRLIHEVLTDERVGVVKITPSHLKLMGSQNLKGAGTKRLVIGGEALESRLALDLMEKWDGKVELYNEYGPTETVVGSTVYKIDPRKTYGSYIPIGKPIANTGIYLLDRDGMPVPVGVPGEVCISGAGVAKGYLNQPDLTAQKFTINPFDPTERLYRTGDLAKWLPDDNLDYQGRMDDQVKVRGYRVELGEIEQKLMAHPDLSAVTVVATQLSANQQDRELVAYVVSEHTLVSGQLNAHLKPSLPDYMIPGYFVQLPALPLTINGKLDKKALPDPRENALSGSAVFVAPQNETEARLVEIWKHILNRPKIGVRDNFFEIGGHSLKATEMIFKVEKALQIRVALVDIFNHPTIEELAGVITAKAGETPETFPQIIPDRKNISDPFPLNSIQQAYWIGRSGELELGNTSTHSYVEYDFKALDKERFVSAIQKMIDRHDTLRVVFSDQGNQRILPAPPPFKLNPVDLRLVSDPVRTAQLTEIREEMSHQIIPHTRWPLFDIRATLLPGDITRLHICIDMLIMDAWSHSILSEEFLQFYTDPSFIPSPLELSYRDYILAEEKFKVTRLFEGAKKYWQDRLPEFPPAAPLPLARSARSITHPRFTNLSGKLPQEEWTKVQAVASKIGVSATAILLSAFSEVLALWSGTQQFHLNLTLFNRLPFHEQINQIVGDFTSVNLLAIDRDPQQTFAERVRKVQQQLWADLENRYYQGVEVIRDLAKREDNRLKAVSPIVFTSMLNMERENSGPEIEANLVYAYGRTSQVWLDHQVMEVNDELYYTWTIVEELFPSGMVENMFAAYTAILQQLSKDDNLVHTPGPNYVPQIEDPNADGTEPLHIPEVPNLLASFLDQARTQPDAPAIETSDHRITYSELDLMTNRIAHWLIGKGAAKNQLVAVLMDKGWEQVAAVVGILKSGAAYLPIDAALPDERIQYLLETGQVTCVITQPWHGKRIDFSPHLHLLEVSTEALSAQADTVVGHRSGGEDLAYVIFTSGSTGKPKGVIIDHRGALNTILDINKRFQVVPSDKVLAVSSLSFDLSVYDVFGVLAAGATLVIPDASLGPDPENWLNLVEDKQVTLWNSVPALMELLLEVVPDGQTAPLSSLRLALLSGDWISLSLARRLVDLKPQLQTISLGGATEASIWSILFPIDEVLPSWKSIPYGKSMWNQQFYVYNQQLNPCPVWVTGDLYIGGIGLAKGYYGDPAKTAERFITHPETGDRLYWTGDQGRLLPDGNIEFLGRVDFQIKIKGHRIELGEIEHALNEFPAIREAIVNPVGETKGDKQLVAYVLPHTETVPSTSAEVKVPQDSIAYQPIRGGEDQFTPISLPRPNLPESISTAASEIQVTGKITLEEFSRLLGSTMQIMMEAHPFPKFRYPSSASLNPVQLFLQVKSERIEGVVGGLYYYHPEDHCLVLMGKGESSPADLFAPHTSAMEAESDFSLFLVGQLKAIIPMYGVYGPDFCLLEAGYMSQLLMETAAENQIGLHPVAYVNPSIITDWFSLDYGQVVLHGILGGRSLDLADRPADSIAPQTSLDWTSTGHDSNMAMETQSRPYIAENGLETLSSKPTRTEFKLKRHGVIPYDTENTVLRLPPLASAKAQLTAFLQRQSIRKFRNVPIPFDAFGSFLSTLLHNTALSHLSEENPFKNTVESLNILLLLKPDRVAGLTGGTYSYDAHSHSLTFVQEFAPFMDQIQIDFNQPVYQESAFSIFLTGKPEKLSSTYGAMARDVNLLQAGYLSQLLMEQAPAHNLGLCPIGNVNESEFLRAFPLAPGELLLHSFLGGGIHPAQLAYWNQDAMRKIEVFNQENLGNWLSQKLPTYMLPSAYIKMDRLPLTANGKVDRKALPIPVKFGSQKKPLFYAHTDQELQRLGTPVIEEKVSEVIPMTALESQMMEIWVELLETTDLDVHSNFFDMGGDSLLAVRFINAFKKKTGKSINLRDLMFQSLKQLALQLEHES